MLKIYSTKTKRGFTLVELIVSIGIMVTVLTIVLASQSNYTSGSALRQSADDISLSLRQAQVYGISVNQLTPGRFDTGYGIEFRIDSSGSKYSYILFADKSSVSGYNKIYDNSWNCDTNDQANECLQKVTLGRGNAIKELCSISLSGDENCGSIVRADVNFLRPATDASITMFDSSMNIRSDNAKGLRIRLISPTGEIKSVLVYTTGQISIEDAK